MEDRSRQWGIDLARVISTYGVVFVHSGGYAPSDNLANQTQALFEFAVPFFLAASFYLLSSSKKESNFRKLMLSRTKRLIIPYLAWSIIYIIARVIKAFINHKFGDVETLFSDPFSILFCGSAAAQLYFLPLLFTGNLIAAAIDKLDKFEMNFKTSLLLFVLSLAVYDVILQSTSGFSMDFIRLYNVFYSLQISNFQPIFKFVLIQSWFIIICLPYIFCARSLRAWTRQSTVETQEPKSSYSSFFLLFFSFLIALIFGRMLIPSFFNEPIFGCLLLIACIKFPFSLSIFSKKILLDLSKASFGIYLIHHLILNFSELVLSKVYPQFMSKISISSLIFISVPGFLISWSIVRIFTNRTKKSIAS
jgi:fucose 4-O-acetylase-like acetyltransferase